MNAKQQAAEAAVREVKNGMTIGLGTGSTAAFAIEAIGRMVREGLSIKAVASSIKSEAAAATAGIPIVPFSQLQQIDIYIDGADEVDKQWNLVKGGGGAMLREKILAFNSKNFIVIVDDSKMVDQLGKFPLPVEVTPFALEFTLRNLEKLGCKAVIRKDGEVNYTSDNGNHIADCHFNSIADPAMLEQLIIRIPGVMECGLFSHTLVSTLIIGYGNGKVEMKTHLSP